jgi:hypothetical protein
VVRLVPLFQHCSRVHEEAILETTKRHGSISVIQHLHVVRALSCYIIDSFCWAGFKREILLRMLFLESGKSFSGGKDGYRDSALVFTLQTILDLCIPFRELAKTRPQISFIYFQSYSAVGLWTNLIPKQ